MKPNRFPDDWNESRVRKVLKHYEEQTGEEAVSEDKAAFALRGQTVMVVPTGLVSEITRLIGRRDASKKTSKRAHSLRRG